MKQSAVENTRDRDGVSEHKCTDLQGGDGVEGYRRADIDESEEHGDYAGKGDGVVGNQSCGADVGDPFCKGETSVTGKGKGLTCRGGVEGDVGGDDEDEDHHCERGDTGVADCLTEDPDEGVV